MTCPVCQAVVSSRADRCPACGHPIHRGFLGRAGPERVVNIVAVALVALVVAGCLLRG